MSILSDMVNGLSTKIEEHQIQSKKKKDRQIVRAKYEIKYDWKYIRNPPSWICNYGGGTPGTIRVKGRKYEYKIVTPLIQGAEQGHHRGDPIYYRRLIKKHRYKVPRHLK